MDVLVELNRLVACSDGRLGTFVRQVCARTVGLPALPAEVSAGVSDADPAVAEFAEQFSVDVSMISDAQRERLREALGDRAFGAVVQMFIGDFVPRVRAGLAAVGVEVAWPDSIAWDHPGNAADALFNGFMPAVARLRSLDPVTSEVVRLRGAAQHNCRLCKSLRETTALDAGGSESLYDEIERFEGSGLLSEAQKAALRYVDALIWTPAHIDAEVAAGVRRYFTDEQAIELTLDVMRNAGNKIAVSLAADAPRVAEGTERYLLDANGQTVFG
ncbi:carboxymuconolactone decarboxylase family protein [[Mycobacterium] nativiensis]|uniref:Carboxymuconolactone decarboxylase family protein n=1 Tax=[Mycobacterium] nativiensis TaxID=2855503 RepID=A0ABU5XYA5_9MYCO|nr:carboxymuconolactone decarboxylase family protein [Mycolicibacter sp. MYC340]MEB3032878.1 carboxymuconolactone decarboxylase family protein [Mycolicibacter sp. MYC340]